MHLIAFKKKSNIEVMEYLSAKILRERKKRKLTQAQFAKLANIPLRTYKRFEQDCNGSLNNFISVLKAFDKTNFLQAIFIEESLQKRPTPIDVIFEAKRKSLSRD
ncbi:MAG: hypothetical protein CTY33_03155 [Methylotenera sp.]|nr:MAG: hypothetical protein CTY33_03155 [Methylotenera sp.]